MKIVKLSAYFRLNFGDDLMVLQLLKRYPDVLFYCSEFGIKKAKSFEKLNIFTADDVYSSKILGRINRLVDLLTFHKKRGVFYKWIFSLIEKKCCTAVYIGGSLFRQRKDENIDKRISVEKNRMSSNHQMYVIGSNFGPYYDEKFFSSYYEFFNECSGVSFRDSYSYNLFKDLSHIKCAPDVVLTVEDRRVTENNKVVISVLGFRYSSISSSVKQKYIEFVSNMCRYIISVNKTPVLTSFCEYEGDGDTIEMVKETLEKGIRDKVETYVYSGDIEQLLDLFATCEFIVATRFHSMILGIRFNKKMFTISYDIKSENVLKDVQNQAWCDIKDVSKFNPSEVFALGAQKMIYSDYIDASQMQFSQLDKFLKAKR